jgi:hypothetical protein
MNERFEELLPWYVNGSLGADERSWVENYLAEHAEARGELDFYRSLSARIQDSAPAVPATIGLARVMTLIRGDRPTFSERVMSFVSSFSARPVTAFAGLVVIAVQGALILDLMHATRDDQVELRALRATTTNEAPMLKVNFAPDAKESEIRHLLTSVQGHLAGGPGQLGDYFVVVPAGKEAAVADQIKTNPIVQAVSLAPGLPPRE